MKRAIHRICQQPGSPIGHFHRSSGGGDRTRPFDLLKQFDLPGANPVLSVKVHGPVISAIPFTHIEEVIERSNKTHFGLGAGVWTRDVGKAHKLARGIRAGSVWINCYQASDPAVPFGGYKMSGYGRERGKQHVEEHLNVKAVWIKTD
jgi:acyl-CoA reductase-like NAD-dependent aldehyde dehydrogenase